MNVVLTRPAPRNKELLQLLSADGLKVLDLPALVLQEQTNAINPSFNIKDYDAIFFVSRLATELFLQNWLPLNQKWPNNLLACAVGFSSAKPLIDSGLINENLIIYPSQEQLNQDSEALWELIKHRVENTDSNIASDKNTIKSALIIRGQTGREWLSNKLTSHAIHVTKIAIYNRRKAIWNSHQIKYLTNMLEDNHKQTVFLLTSSESLSAICNNISNNGLLGSWSKCIFVCVHHRIATALQVILTSNQIDGAEILITTPTNQDIYKTIRSLAH